MHCKTLSRRSVCSTLLIAVFISVTAAGHGQALAQPFPTRPIRLVVPVPPGGPVDRPARVLAEKLQAELGQPIVVENKAGASGILAAGQVLRGKPDGYTLLLSVPSAQITAPLMQSTTPYNGAKDFTAIGGFGRFTAVLLVNETVPVRNYAELIAYAKQHPNQLNYGSTGMGGIPHLVTELLKLRTGIEIIHVPYKGGAAIVQSLVANETQILFGEIATALPWIESGRLRPLAVISEQRSPLLPEVPTLAEEGLADAPVNVSWMGLAGPAGMPDAIVRRLADALQAATQDPDLQQSFRQIGSEADARDPDALQATWEADQELWSSVIKANNLRAD